MKTMRFLSLLAVATAALALALPALGQSLPDAGWLASETAADYRAQARYPAHARALAGDGEDPIVTKRTPSPITVAARAEQGASLTVWPAAVAFVAPRPAVVYGRLSDPHGQAVAGDVRGEVVDEAGAVRAKLAFFDDGVAPDTAAGDGVYTAVHVPAAAAKGVRAESLMVRVSALARGERAAIEAVTGYLLSHPGATLTGRFRDAEAGGDLVVGAEVRVELAGRYHLAATIEAADGTLIGMAQAARQLAPGRQWLDLEFYGLMFSERGVAGPYRVAAITLTDATSMPNALGEVMKGAHTTRAYPLARFTREGFGEPALLESARRLEADAARSRDDR